MITALTFKPYSPQTSTHFADNIFAMEDALSDLASSQHRLERAPCSNTKEVDGLMLNCDNEANLVCSQCFLVKVRGDFNSTVITSRQICSLCPQYCGHECQKAHWHLHKADCKSELREANWQPTWWREKRKPTFDGLSESTSFDPFGTLRYLWGGVPSFDVLNLAKNEGTGYGNDLALCFAGEYVLAVRIPI